MKRNELKKEYRSILAGNWSIRCAIGLDIAVHQQTIQRWATNNSPKLTTDHFLKSFRKHGKIDKSIKLLEEVSINQPHDLVH
jgi:hypothetical protein